eukprot:comp16644_c0_seq1/m.26890 comp16644_c0_seq1/g.26890  ORF comp16644_c0_seq1/g.26890 comp16644_c0_seq1/m.26890 type:complete len:309 (-) comp16644_c0_seq1:45-971(-)
MRFANEFVLSAAVAVFAIALAVSAAPVPNHEFNPDAKLCANECVVFANSSKETKSLCSLQKYKSRPLVCMHVTTSEGTRVVPFYPSVDRFAVLSVRGSGYDPWITRNPGNVTVRMEVNGMVTAPRHWGTTASSDVAVSTGDERGGQVPFWTVRVGMTAGIVNAVLWDDLGCSPGICATDALCVVDDDPYNYDLNLEPVQNKNCATLPPEDQTIIQCAANTNSSVAAAAEGTEATKSNCDLKVYIVWRGTDKRGQVLESDGLRLSEMLKYSIKKTFVRASDTQYDAAASFTPSFALLAVAILLSFLSLS